MTRVDQSQGTERGAAMEFQLKTLSPEAVARALAKAERYRLLNEPGEAESICLDALEIEPDNQEALTTLLLALTDQFADASGSAVADALNIVPRFRDEYDRAYYTGIIYERRAKAQLGHAAPGSGPPAYQWLRDAMLWYEKAEAIRPAGNDDAILRWNACARLIMRNRHLVPLGDERRELLFLE
jgi:hypothetical protein